MMKYITLNALIETGSALMYKSLIFLFVIVQLYISSRFSKTSILLTCALPVYISLLDNLPDF